MSFKKNIGVKIDIPGDLPLDKKLFSETGGFILEIRKENLNRLMDLFTKYNVQAETIGHTILEPVLQINSVIHLPILEAKEVYESGLRARLNT